MTATATDGTHPTGMHSCCFLFVVCDCYHDNSSAPGHKREQEEAIMLRNIIFGPATPKVYCIDCDGIAENGDEVNMTS